MRLKNFGIKLLKSHDGHYLLTDSRLKHDKLITKKRLGKASRDAFEAYYLVQDIIKYLKKHDELKWTQVKRDLIEIGKTDRAFLLEHKTLIKSNTVKALMALDRDIYFWKTENQPDKILNKKMK